MSSSGSGTYILGLLLSVIPLACGDRLDGEQRAIARIEFYTTTGSTGTLVFDEAAPRRTLIELDLGRTAVLDAAMRPVGKLTSIRKLNLQGALTITDQGIELLSGLENLESLDLSETKISQDALQYLQRMTRLESLALANNPRIEDSGLNHLSKLTTLRNLNLSGTSISDAGIEKLLPLRALEVLNLGTNSRVSDEGLKRLRRLPQLQKVMVVDTSVTEAGARDLEAARPGLAVQVVESP